MGRFFSFEVHAAVFTNLSQDHLDFHGDMESYARAKRRLFEGAGARPPAFGVINADDPVGRQYLELDGFQPLSYALDREADVTAEGLKADFDGLSFDLRTPRGSVRVQSPLLGLFNARNLLAAAAAGLACGVDLETIRAGLADCAGAPGRFETVREGQEFLVVVDYAHTPDALENLLGAARRLLPAGRSGYNAVRLRRRPRPCEASVDGRGRGTLERPSNSYLRQSAQRRSVTNHCGRDGRITARWARTSCARPTGPPRSAVRSRRPVRATSWWLAGKGHETVQKIGGRALSFDDREVAREVLREMRNGRRAG